jgi:hypothetical protein
MGPSSPMSSPVVSSSLEHVGCLVLCLGLSGVLNLFCQNKLKDVSPCGWMLQKGYFAYGLYPRSSHLIMVFIIKNFCNLANATTYVPAQESGKHTS